MTTTQATSPAAEAETTKKPRDTTGPLEPAIAATRIAKIVQGAPERIKKKENAVLVERHAIVAEVKKVSERVTSGERAKLLPLLLALGIEDKTLADFGLATKS